MIDTDRKSQFQRKACELNLEPLDFREFCEVMTPCVVGPDCHVGVVMYVTD